MRYQPQHKAETHRRLLDMAALRFRAEGLANVGIANLMADLGLTHGGFYAHFDSKQQLVAEASQQAILALAADWQQRLAHPPDGQRHAGRQLPDARAP
ncbi:TetR/AcrR family transcriptional regulator [Paludibacterium denitrificans]|uniref:TetR/AcrR family transcriptional regulator n=1 Tax=Paludibacterium denitrificans TaxID=2675226 RepID=UPI001E463551|nr:TetR/AcrR family transcriptional regulator [Paludibacterium denitrificans]